MTLNRLLDVAIIAFGRNGLEGTSTRQIAKAAGTAMSAITYHYGGKEQLYLAAADRIAETIAETMAPVQHTEAEIAAMSNEQARAAVHGMLLHLTDQMLSDRNIEYSQFLLREQLNPTEAFDRIYKRLMGGMLDTLMRLIMTATRAPQERAALTTIALMGQALVPRYAHTSMSRLLGKTQFDTHTRNGFRSQLTMHIDAILDRMAAEQKDFT